MIRTAKRAQEIVNHNRHWMEWNQERAQETMGKRRRKHLDRIKELEENIKQIKFEAFLIGIDVPE